ncbi:MAG TPA: hypothetical protein DEO93_12505 [Stenotrophomonas sp.]|nr:hypothetical protein [Stenotrophomonas sp.]
MQRATCSRSLEDRPASRRGGGSRARWQFAASGLFYVQNLAGALFIHGNTTVWPPCGRVASQSTAVAPPAFDGA